jgi:hypothetical protein
MDRWMDRWMYLSLMFELAWRLLYDPSKVMASSIQTESIPFHSIHHYIDRHPWPDLDRYMITQIGSTSSGFTCPGGAGGSCIDTGVTSPPGIFDPIIPPFRTTTTRISLKPRGALRE